MRKIRLILFCTFAFLCIIFTLNSSVFAENISGECGENVTWLLNNVTGELVISGNGKMTSSPWSDYKPYIKTVVVNDGVETISDQAFGYCTNITSVVVGDDVQSIGTYAFAGCSSLSEIKLGSSLNKIGACAFDKCIALAEVNIPDEVTLIDGGAFGYCSGLVNVKFGGKLKSLGNYAFAGCGMLCEANIPNSVTVVGNYAFSGCYALKKVSLGENTTVIGNSAFEYCTSIESMYIPAKVNSIGEQAFNACERLRNINVDELNEFYASDKAGVLYDKNYKTLIRYPQASVTDYYNIQPMTTDISDWAFSGAKKLKRLNIPISVANIYYAAFYENSKLSDIYYIGTEDQFGDISIDNANDSLINASKHFLYEQMKNDINSDGYVNSKDITMLRCYLVGGYNVPDNNDVCDINNDGIVSIKDVTALRKIIAGGY